MSSRTLLVLSLAFISFCNFIFIWNLLRRNDNLNYCGLLYQFTGDSGAKQSSAYRGHDFPKTLPLSEGLGTLELTVSESSAYSLQGWASDREWSALAGSFWGYVRLGSESRLFVVTMFHELHCLRILNLAFDPSNIVGDGHISHCLNYLRQMALCQPDLTLESADWEKKDFDTDITGATHVCRDWEGVSAILEKNFEIWKETKKRPPFA
ncbi:hypothetical protein V5O48_008693 [Marasmius crinis-equi]|uniref:Oxidase ustYa n=1 Tax=Marasmius crinis-equi TaxID=585013 RepID=A0ABR3FDA2_9AGAR